MQGVEPGRTTGPTPHSPKRKTTSNRTSATHSGDVCVPSGSLAQFSPLEAGGTSRAGACSSEASSGTGPSGCGGIAWGNAAAWSATRHFSTRRRIHFGTGPPSGSFDFLMVEFSACVAPRAAIFAETSSSASGAGARSQRRDSEDRPRGVAGRRRITFARKAVELRPPRAIVSAARRRVVCAIGRRRNSAALGSRVRDVGFGLRALPQVSAKRRRQAAAIPRRPCSRPTPTSPDRAA